jgi:hypothetical protein
MFKTSLILKKKSLFPTFHIEKPTVIFSFSNMNEGRNTMNACNLKK